MRRVLWLLILALIAVPAGWAQETLQKPEAKAPEVAPTESLPTVDQVFEKFVEAIGGKSALEKITSRQAKGVFEIPEMGASGTLTMFAKAPNKTAMTIDIPGFGTIQQACDGTVAWENNPMVGMRELAGVELSTRKRDATFHQELKFKELYKKIEVKAKQKVGEKETFVLEATPDEGGPEKLYFDAESGLMVRHDAERQGPQGSAQVESYYEDYRDVDGVKVPFTIRQVMPQFKIQIKFDEVKQNVEIEDSKFAKPSA